MLHGILILLFIAIISGLIAYLGNQLGRYVGRKRLSIFNLRPRHTAALFTVVTGMLISLLTIGLSAVLSNNVRTALFGIEKLQKERETLTQQIKNLTDLASQGKIIFTADQPIFIGIIKGSNSKEIKTRLDELLSAANKIAVMKNDYLAVDKGEPQLNSSEKLLYYIEDEYKEIIKDLSGTTIDWGIMIYSLKNVFYKERVPVGIKFKPNNIVFPKDIIIAQIDIDSYKNKNEILSDLFLLLRQAQFAAGEMGMIKNPITNTYGGEFDPEYFYSKRDEIKRIGGWVKAKIIANRDIHSIDSLDVSLHLEPTYPPKQEKPPGE